MILSGREKLFALICALLRLALCSWRAAHQSIVIDEAITYNRFVSGPWLKLFGRYDANNHILSSILIKCSIETAGLSPFTLRLPSLLAGSFLTLGVFWLLKSVESAAVRWTVFAAVCLHPLLLDFSIAARGYSISLAFFVWALYFCLDRAYLPSGILLGLSIAANLSMLFPVLALLGVVTFLDRKLPLNLAVSTLLLAALINGPALRHATRADFYLGYPDLHPALTSFVFSSLHAKPDNMGILGGRTASDRIGMLGLPVLLLLLAAISLEKKDRRQLIFLTLIATLLGLALAHWLIGLNYPADRTCLYFVILAAVAWAFAADSSPNRWARALWLLPLFLLLIQFITQLQVRYFEFWQEETDDRQIALLIRQASVGKPDGSLTVSASWIHQPSLEFYRRCWHIAALKPVERIEPTPLTGFDFYVLSGVDLGKSTRPPAFFDPQAGVKLITSCADSRGCN